MADDREQHESDLRVINIHLSSLRERLSASETRLSFLEKDVSVQVGMLLRTRYEEHEEIKQAIQAHAMNDLKSFREIEDKIEQSVSAINIQLGLRVPPWAVFVMTFGGSAIGALAMWIITHGR